MVRYVSVFDVCFRISEHLSDFRVQNYNISAPNARIMCIDMCIDICIATQKHRFFKLKRQKKPSFT